MQNQQIIKTTLTTYDLNDVGYQQLSGKFESVRTQSGMAPKISFQQPVKIMTVYDKEFKIFDVAKNQTIATWPLESGTDIIFSILTNREIGCKF